MELMSLPNELLCQILLDDDITICDLYHLMLSCKRFLNVIQDSNELWKQKFLTRWSGLSHMRDQKESFWVDLAQNRVRVSQSVLKKLTGISEMCYPEGEPSLSHLNSLTEEDELGFVEDELLHIIFHQDLNSNLTERFYGQKVLRFLRTRKLENQWATFLSLPKAQQSLLTGAVMISHWGQMDKEHVPSLERVKSLVDGIVERVNQLLSASTSSKTPKKILSCVNQVLYEEMGFQGNVNDYHAFENSYIDKVLENRRGIPITLCIIYSEVASRLGVLCEPVSFPHHFLLRWREFPEREEPESFTYIDAFNGGALHMPRSCPALIGQPRHNIRREAYAAVDPNQVFQRMVNNLIQCSRVQWDHGQGDQNGLKNQLHFSRLACAVTPGQLHSVVGYAELCAFLGIQLEEAIQLLQSQEFSDDQFEVNVEPGHASRICQITYQKVANKLSYQLAQSNKRIECRRPGSVKYAVGMVMRHLKFNYTCVIAFWDSRCKASDEWMERMGIRDLVRGMDQPFYHVLVNDGSSRYAAEENLERAIPATVINHPEVGRHFSIFDGQRYIPNPEKRAHFPEDEAVIHSLLH